MPTRDASQGRIRHPKVKTGCITCRTRRVKCDETRPQCIRCLKYGTECGGYLPGRRRPPSSFYGAQQARALVPKNQGPLMLQPASSLFDSELELRYFRLFSDRIATEISPYFNADSWSRMILQACMHEASIRHAAVAIGALGKSYEMAQAGKCPVNGETLMLKFERLPAPGTTRESRTRHGIPAEDLASEGYIHHKHALEQYDKAFRKMRNDVMKGDESMRTRLIICIIVVCFEAMYGEHESAAELLQSGLRMIQDWVAEQNRNLRRHPQGFSSPAPDVIEDFLVQSFGRMEIQSMSVFDPRPVETHAFLKDEGRDTVQDMPSQFSSIEQARIYLDLISRRSMHFTSVHVPRGGGGSVERPKPRPPLSSRNQATTAWKKLISPMPLGDGGKIPRSNTLSTLPPQPLLEEQVSLAQELKSWTDAFSPLLTYSRANGGQDAISALALSISSISSHISLRATFFINESAYDQLLPEFRLIVEKASDLFNLESSRNRGSSPSSPTSPGIFTQPKEPLIHFAFDIGVVPPLYLCAIKCRDRKLRHQALKLMEDHPRREGVWDSVATAALARWVIKLEEEGTRRYRSVSPISSTFSSSSIEPTRERSRSQTQETNPHYPLKQEDQGPRRFSSSSPISSCGTEHSSPSSDPARERSRSRTLGADPGTPGTFVGSPLSKEIEGGDLEDLFIPEEMRVTKVAMTFDLLARRANLKCLQMDIEKGLWVQRTEVFSW